MKHIPSPDQFWSKRLVAVASPNRNGHNKVSLRFFVSTELGVFLYVASSLWRINRLFDASIVAFAGRPFGTGAGTVPMDIDRGRLVVIGFSLACSVVAGLILGVCRCRIRGRARRIGVLLCGLAA
jgi:hypothetical protein